MVDSQLAEKNLMPFYLLSLLFFVMPVSAQTHWFNRHSEGWFWYETIQESEPGEATKEQSSETITYPLHSAAWIRHNIGRYLDRAIDHPSKENVSTYLYLDRLVKERAERFARVGKQIIESDPMLDENVRRPISPAAAKINDDRAHQAKESVLKEIARVSGLVFYYQGQCRLCQLQIKTLKAFCQQYGFTLIPISTDGVLLPEVSHSKIETHPPDALNIMRYPALFLLRPPDQIALLRQGNLSLTELSEQVLQVALRHHWITPEQFKQTRIVYETWSLYELPPSLHKAIKHSSVRH